MVRVLGEFSDFERDYTANVLCSTAQPNPAVHRAIGPCLHLEPDGLDRELCLNCLAHEACQGCGDEDAAKIL
jgi:hypothetical protein